MKNKEVADIFNKVAALLEIKGDNPYRIRAYQKAAQTIEALTADVEELAKQGKLEKLPGIGPDLASKIKEILKTGTLPLYEELKKDVPLILLNFLEIPGLGPKKVKVLYEKLGITNIEELERACKAHKIAKLPGFGWKTEENILKGIKLFREKTGRKPLGEILSLAEEIIETLKKESPVENIAVAGSIRRRKETVKDIDILITSIQPEKVMKKVTELSLVEEVIAFGETKTSVRLKTGIQMDVRVVEPDSWGAALAYFTGSKAHNIRVRELALEKGLKINEYGVFKGDTKIAGKTEEEVYASVGLPFIHPELREDRGEIEAALHGKLPKLVEYDEILGDAHVHSKYSDGTASLEEIMAKAEKLGLSWVAVCDHSQGLKVAGGLSIEDLFKKKKHIEELNKRSSKVKLIFGSEVDILSDGTLDYPDEILAEIDYVVAAIHTGFQQSEEQITNRIISALKHPLVHAIAHPTGRVIGEREPYAVNIPKILEIAAQYGKALEINAYYKRLDLNDINTRAAKEKGIPLIIGTDTHFIDQMEYLHLGTAVARRGWCEKSDVLNTLTYEEFMAWLKKVRNQS
ncbi:MAG: Histidinol phosphatase or related hydrolase of the PHP family [Thermodesulfobacteria bacterium]|nr:DNA polymerase/3'-5' exonuclease PolX [Thermodesulfobacteriota bacterium]MCU4137368.1 Histidinol phosphatase or related hydrolase of the PHP family [Thermodesulfobacteriota bacterium]